MQRPTAIGLTVAAVAVGAATVAVIFRGPQEAVPLAVASAQPSAAASVDAGAGSPEPTPTAEPSPTAAPSPSETPAPIPGQVITNGDRAVSKVAITFDTAYSPASAAGVATGALPAQYDAGVVQALQELQAPATVFVTGVWAKDHPQQMAVLAADPAIEIGNHTYSHLAWTSNCYDLPRVGDQASQTAEVISGAEAISAVTGQAPRFLRFPALCGSDEGAALAASLGQYSIGSDVATNDAFAFDPQVTVAGILSEVQPGSIIVLHLNGAPNAPITPEILRLLIPSLRERGLEPAPLAEVIGLDSAEVASPAPTAAETPPAGASAGGPVRN